MAEVEVTQDDVKQAEALQRALSAPRTEALDLCAAWKIVKPFWAWIIKLVRLIPKVGAAIATALEFIGNALDTFCKTK